MISAICFKGAIYYTKGTPQEVASKLESGLPITCYYFMNHGQWIIEEYIFKEPVDIVRTEADAVPPPGF